jgi:hypothetical protein
MADLVGRQFVGGSVAANIFTVLVTRVRRDIASHCDSWEVAYRMRK